MKIILNIIREEDATFALRAAKWLLRQPGDVKDGGILAYGDDNDPPTFWVKRNKASVTSRQLPFKNTGPCHDYL